MAAKRRLMKELQDIRKAAPKHFRDIQVWRHLLNDFFKLNFWQILESEFALTGERFRILLLWKFWNLEAFIFPCLSNWSSSFLRMPTYKIDLYCNIIWIQFTYWLPTASRKLWPPRNVPTSIITSIICIHQLKNVIFQVDEQNILQWQGLLVPEAYPFNKGNHQLKSGLSEYERQQGQGNGALVIPPPMV